MTTTPLPQRSPRTETLSVAVTCPTWCTVTAQQHLDDFDNIEGCIHHSSETAVPDTTHGPGWHPIEGRHPADPVSLWMSTETRLDGREKTSPTVFIDGKECSVEQALALAAAIRELVEVYRLAGGVA